MIIKARTPGKPVPEQFDITGGQCFVCGKVFEDHNPAIKWCAPENFIFPTHILFHPKCAFQFIQSIQRSLLKLAYN